MTRTLVCGAGVGLFLKTGTLSSLAFFKFHTNKKVRVRFVLPCPGVLKTLPFPVALTFNPCVV